jgi:hypothetical protein
MRNYTSFKVANSKSKLPSKHNIIVKIILLEKMRNYTSFKVENSKSKLPSKHNIIGSQNNFIRKDEKLHFF